VVEYLVQRHPTLPVAVITAHGCMDTAIESMKAGAFDFISKPVNLATLRKLVATAIQSSQLPSDSEPQAPLIIGEAPAIKALNRSILKLARSQAPIYISGESGAGKELVARSIHELGPRAEKPFVAVNCGAIPRDLMESELFGVVRGAYTGAHEDRKGAAELADGGTLFLDEIGEMDLSLQSKLLRFLQTGMMSRVGESGTRRIDARVICATNRNPMQMIADKTFREDLFYRLHVLPIHLPPLRQRPADIMVLARHFLETFAPEERKQFSGFSAEAAAAMLAREWPGNVRQLQNLTRRLVVMFDGGEIDAAMLRAADIESREAVTETAPAPRERRPVLPMWQQEQRIIEDAIASFNGNISLAAAALEISPSTIYRKRQSWAEIGTAGAA
jgi:two-component system repressor protein LuxO